MNAQQRKFLIERISSKSQEKIKILKDQKKQSPNRSNYLFREVMSGKIKLQPETVISEAIKKLALKSRQGESWLSGEKSYYSTSSDKVVLKVEDLLIIPKDLDIEIDEITKHNNKIDKQIDALKTQFETLEVRLQLASNSTLEKMISEIDDMGKLSLIDTKLKLLT